MIDALSEGFLLAVRAKVESTLQLALKDWEVAVVPSIDVKDVETNHHGIEWESFRFNSKAVTVNGSSWVSPVRDSRVVILGRRTDKVHAVQIETAAQFPLERLSTIPRTTLNEIREIARNLRRIERLIVLDELCRDTAPQFPPTIGGIRSAVRLFNPPLPPDHRRNRWSIERFPCRLLGSADLVRTARTASLVEDQFVIDRRALRGCVGVVFPMVDGPIAKRIGEVSCSITVVPSPSTANHRLDVSLLQRVIVTGATSSARIVEPVPESGPPHDCCAGPRGV